MSKDPQGPEAPRGAEAQVSLPLEGMRVLDATHIVAGPFCSMLLGDAGAEVIKIERPGTGERGRRTRPIIYPEHRTGPQEDQVVQSTSPISRVEQRESGQWVSARYLAVNRNKRSMSLDLRHPRGKAIFEELVRISDVVLDNWGPGAMKRLGVGYDRLSSINPAIIYASITGYGDSDALRGPYSTWAANNPCAQAMAGWMEITGEPGGPPQMVGDNIGDSVPSVWTAYAILLALESRRKTGLGQHVDMAMYDCMVAHNTSTIPMYEVTGQSPGRNRENMVQAQLTLKAKDGYVILAGAGDEDKWVALWKLIGREDLVQDSSYLGRNVTGLFFINEIQPALEEWTQDISKWDLTQTLLELGFSAAMVQNAEDMVHCPHLQARKMWTGFEDPIGGWYTVPANPVKLSRVAERPPGRPPSLGEHNEEVLRGLLGLSHNEIRDIKAEGII